MDKKEKLRLFPKFTKWYHTISLGNGILTPGDPGNNRMKWKAISKCLPEKVCGRTFIDFGPAEGYFSIKMFQKGACRGICIEHSKKMIAKFEFCMRCIFGKVPDELKIINLEIDDLISNKSTDVSGSWDYSVALAITHWVKDPILFIQYLAGITKFKSFVEIVVNDIDKRGIRTHRKSRMFKWQIGKDIFVDMSRCAGFKNINCLKDYVTSFGSHRALYELSK